MLLPKIWTYLSILRTFVLIRYRFLPRQFSNFLGSAERDKMLCPRAILRKSLTTSLKELYLFMVFALHDSNSHFNLATMVGNSMNLCSTLWCVNTKDQFKSESESESQIMRTCVSSFSSFILFQLTFSDFPLDLFPTLSLELCMF